MKPKGREAQRHLRDSIEDIILPALETMGFVLMEIANENVPDWHLHRKRTDGGFDAISMMLDDLGQPILDVVINVIPAEGLTQPWGEFLEASKAPAIAPASRVLIQRKRKGLLPLVFPIWFSHDAFRFEAKADSEGNRCEATRTTQEFLACLDQAERWWVLRELGPNLVVGNIGP